MQSRSRPLGYLVLAGLSASLNVACSQAPGTHTSFVVSAAAGASGSAGTSGGAGTSGTAGTSDAAMPPPSLDGSTTVDGGMTVGCGMIPMQPTGTYFQYTIPVAGPDIDATTNKPKVRQRIYFVRLPKTYDQTIPWRVIYIGPGCGGNTASEVMNLNAAANESAILVAVMPLPEFGACFDETANSVEYPFFDAVHKTVESSFCVDPTRQFYAGFSTGARLGYMLDCAFPDVLRATASIQGALPPLPTCENHSIAMMAIADTLETGNPYQGNVQAAQHVFVQNGCTGTFNNPMPPTGCGASCATYDVGSATPLPAPVTSCVTYTGCPAAYPVVFCSSIMAGHQTYEEYLTTAKTPWSDQLFWNFFKSF
jgi:poly(3-hydroxybutyrate) depolymerase